MQISIKIYQITNPFDGNIYNLWKELGENLPVYKSLEGTEYMYLLAVLDDKKSIENALNIFNKYKVYFIDQKSIIVDSSKFNSNYILDISYFSKDYYVITEPYKYYYSFNTLKINSFGYPIDIDGNIINGCKKLPACKDDPEFHEICYYNYDIIKNNNKL